MHLEGNIEVQAKKIDVFNRLNDVHFFASCIEGVTNLQEIEKNKCTIVIYSNLTGKQSNQHHKKSGSFIKKFD
jgi:carbon monoxide dehydrogenase subunit G